MRFTKRQRELIPETRWSIAEGAISYLYRLQRMMKVAEQEWRRMKSEYSEDVEWRWGYKGTAEPIPLPIGLNSKLPQRQVQVRRHQAALRRRLRQLSRHNGEWCVKCCSCRETIDPDLSTPTVSVGRWPTSSVCTSPTTWNAFTSRSPPLPPACSRSLNQSSMTVITRSHGSDAVACSCRPLPTRYERCWQRRA